MSVYWMYSKGTANAADNFDDEEAAQKLKDAMKGFGTNEEEIIEVLTSFSLDQRLQIRDKYKVAFGQDLLENLKDELGGNFEDVCLGLLTEPRTYDAQWIKKAVDGAGTKEKLLVEVLCPRTNEEIEGIKEAYKELTDEELEERVVSETSGHLQRILVSQLQGARDPIADVDEDSARADAQELFDAGEAIVGTDESTFNKILASRSLSQLQEIFKIYHEISGKDIVEAIESETTGDLEDAYVTIAKYVKDPAGYFAEVLYNAMSGGGTDDDTLQRIIIGHCEVDMYEIRMAYLEKYEKSLGDAVADDVSGDYSKILLKLIGTPE